MVRRINLRNWLRDLRRLGKRSSDTRAMFYEIGHGLVAQTQLNLRRGVDANGRKFKPLRPITKLLRRGDGEKAQPMRDTGRLARSFVFQVQGRKALKFGSNWNPKALGAHQRGALIRPKKAGGRLFLGRVGGRGIFAKQVRIPTRKVLPDQIRMPPWVRNIINRAAERHLRRAVK